MVKDWRFKEEAKPTTGSILEAGIGAIKESPGGEGYEDFDNMSYKELVKQPAGKFVKTKQRWCKERFVAESYGRGKNIEKISKKRAFLIIKKAIEEKNPQKFETIDIIKWTDALDKTDGIFQNRLLSSMVCLGFIENRNVPITKKGKKSFKHVFIKSNNGICPHLQNGKCKFDWKEGSVTDYFPEEYKEEE
ncbi:MAG: hypothetical protein P8X70_00490 [Nanoarchaeota archaeon]